MEIIFQKITPESPLNRDVERLLDQVFPADERFPMEWLREQAARDLTDYYAIFDGDQFVGFYYGFHSDAILYGLYLAIDPGLQSKGYGTAIINRLKEVYGGRDVVFCIEPLDEDCPNPEQRKRRFRLYERLGFRLTGYSYFAPERYWVMSDKGPAFRNESFEALLRELSPEAGKVEIRRDVDLDRQYL